MAAAGAAAGAGAAAAGLAVAGAAAAPALAVAGAAEAPAPALAVPLAVALAVLSMHGGLGFGGLKGEVAPLSSIPRAGSTLQVATVVFDKSSRSQISPSIPLQVLSSTHLLLF